MKKSLLNIVGWSLLLSACVCWLALIVIPFLSLSLGIKASLMAGCIVTGEVLFWLGILCIGKEAWNRFKRRKDKSNNPI